MKPLDTLLESETFRFLREMLEKHPQAEAYVVGGPVRDALIGRRIKDFDIVICGVEQKDLRRFLERYGKVDLVGTRFGVFKFRPKGETLDVPIDIALPRTEVAGGSGAYRDFDVHTDHTLPVEDDLKRRDFTVNAMAWDLRRKYLVDPEGGRKDLEDKRLRTVGDPRARFSEDASRLFRGLRFAVQLGAGIEEETRLELEAGLASYDETVVPKEVIAREFLQSLMADPVRTPELWSATGAFRRVMPELIQWDAGALARLGSKEFKSFFGETRPSPNVCLAVLLYPLGAGAASDLVRRLRFSAVPDLKTDPDRVTWLVHHYAMPHDDLPEDLPPSRVQEMLFRAPGRKTDLLMTSWTVTETRFIDEWLAVEKLPDLVTGDDIMRVLGIGPGPDIKKVLDHLKDLQGRGTLRTSEEAIDHLNARANDPEFSRSLR